METRPVERAPWTAFLQRPFPRYCAAGVLSAAVDFSVYKALIALAHMDPVAAHAFISRPLGGITCFTLNRAWTFRSRGSIPPQFLRFWCVFGVSLLLTAGLLALFAKGLGMWPVPAKALAEALAFVFNFLALKHWTFRCAS